MKSYHLKTWFFWFLESKEPQFWEDGNSFQQALKLFEFVHDEMGKGICKHYFKHDVDLLSAKGVKDVMLVRKELKMLMSWVHML